MGPSGSFHMEPMQNSSGIIWDSVRMIQMIPNGPGFIELCGIDSYGVEPAAQLTRGLWQVLGGQVWMGLREVFQD